MPIAVLLTPIGPTSVEETQMLTIPQGTVYLIENTVSHTVYIGLTMADPARRWTEHQSKLRNGHHKNPHLQAAWNRYGAEVFEFCILETYLTLAATNEAERFYIQYLRAIGVRLYNHKSGGDGGGGHSEASRAKMRALKLGTKASEATKAKMRGKIVSEETRAKQSAAHTGYRHSEETKAKMGIVWRGRKHTEESKTKMHIAQTGKTLSEETKAKQSAALKGRPKSEEWKAKMRKRAKRED